ncbi:MAG: insulinase family protein, partial [Candidatus Neomarinimicrobiota bacterium]
NRLYIAGLLLEQLAFGENSDLYKRLVLKEQKVEFITANFSVNRDAKLNEIYTMVKSEDDLDYVREQIYMTMEQFKTEVVDDTRLEELKMHLRYSFLMYLDTPDNVAGNLANYIAITGGIETVNQLFANIMTVTAVDIQEAAQYYGMPAKRTVIILKGVES